MNAKVEQDNGARGADIAKLTLAAVLVVAGIVGFYYFADAPKLMRIFGLIAIMLAAAGVFAISGLGRQTRSFLTESSFELRKVVWPSREETLRATAVIVVVVIILSLLLGLIDLALKVVVMDWLLKR
jgi:preprotein translocase subunit SecE